MKTEQEIKDELEHAKYLIDHCPDSIPSSIYAFALLDWVLERGDYRPYFKRECDGCDLTRKFGIGCRLIVDKNTDT